MSRITAILIFVFLSCDALCAEAVRKIPPLHDGFGLTGVDGKLSSADGKWFFEFDSDVGDGFGLISAGSIVELLPSTALEKITVDIQNRPDTDYRLWGNVTKYKDENFIFPIYFLPVSAAEDQNKPGSSAKAKIAINEPNDALAIPEEIVKKLKNRRVLRQEQLKVGVQLKQDYILTGRTALLERKADGEAEVILDAFGRNVPEISFRLLPCEVLARAQYEQSIEADPVRFKIAGILTQYKGEYYLLLQKATRAYSHENFGR
ncbi:MAG: hypothetical protein PHY02_02495 [Phycisphaerae bacterium]|nr:hypothetical protein [Phycisphaerae bacterium]